MEPKIRVYGTAQNRTALGIANAYVRLNPDSTIDDLNKAFPETLNNTTDADLFVKVDDESDKKPEHESPYFDKEDEFITLKDGTRVMMFKTWSKADYAKIVEKSKSYQIDVAECKPAQPFEKGGFVLEDIKKKRWWLWLLIAIVVIILIILLFRNCCDKKAPAPEPVVAVAVDTPKVEPKVNLQEKFTCVKFEKGKFAVDDALKPALIEMANVMKEFDKINIKIQGHASKDGSLDFNNKLAQKRAQSVADFIVSQGVGAERIKCESYGITQPTDAVNLEPNRRVEFVVVE